MNIRFSEHTQWQVEAWRFEDWSEFRQRPPALGWFAVGWYGTEAEAVEGFDEFRAIFTNLRLIRTVETKDTIVVKGQGDYRKALPEPEGSDWTKLPIRQFDGGFRAEVPE